MKTVGNADVAERGVVNDRGYHQPFAKAAG